MTYRVLCDENVEVTTVSELERRGLVATHVTNRPGRGSTDEAVARFARNNGFVLLTNDTDFLDGSTYPDVTVLYFPDNRVSGHQLADRVEELTLLVSDPANLPKETFLTE